MVLIGVGFIAIAIITFIAAKPRNGVIKLNGHPFLEVIAAIGVTGASVVGITLIVAGWSGIELR